MPKKINIINISFIIDNLPHVYIPELEAHFLIDTGSAPSLIKPEVAYKYYPNHIRYEYFSIKTAHTVSERSEMHRVRVTFPTRISGSWDSRARCV